MQEKESITPEEEIKVLKEKIIVLNNKIMHLEDCLLYWRGAIINIFDLAHLSQNAVERNRK